MVFSTNSFSNRPTSFLNVSISFQQSSGRRSCVRRHATTASLALPTSASTCSSFFRLASFCLLGDAVPAHILLPLLLGEGRLGGCGIRDLLDEGRLAGLLGLVGERLAVFGEVLGFLLAQLLELGGQAFLVLEFLLP
jgi:hypothetical protein